MDAHRCEALRGGWCSTEGDTCPLRYLKRLETNDAEAQQQNDGKDDLIAGAVPMA